MLCGGSQGIKWINDVHNEMAEEKNKTVAYFEEHENMASEINLNMEEHDLDTTEQLKLGEEDMAIDMRNVNTEARMELKKRVDEFFAEFKDEEGTCVYSVEDIAFDDNYCIVYNAESEKHFKVEYEVGEEFAVYLDAAEEIEYKAECAEEFKEEEAKEEDSKEDSEDDDAEEEKEEDEEEEFKEEEKEDEKEEEKEGEFSEEETKSEEEFADAEEETTEDNLTILYAEIEAYKSEIQTLKEENESLKQYKVNSEMEKKAFEIESTLEEIIAKCPNMPQEDIDGFRTYASEFDLSNLDFWKNAVKAKAWAFTTNHEVTNDVARIALDYTNKNKDDGKKKLWT